MSLSIDCGEEACVCQCKLQMNHTAFTIIGSVFDSNLIITTRLIDGGEFAVFAPPLTGWSGAHL